VRSDTTAWLLDADPAVAWQVKGDPGLRARVAREGWGARLLALQRTDGSWDGGACFPASWSRDEPGQPWTATMHTLQTLQIFGLDPAGPAATEMIARVAEGVRWEHDGQPFFDGEVEECINGRTIDTGAYFGVDVAPLVDRVLATQKADGGWNCYPSEGSSFDTTLNVLDGLLTADGPAEARRRGEEYLLARGLFRRLSTGAVVKPEYLDFAFPYYWHYDVLRALDYFRRAGRRDPRMAEAVELVRSKRQPDGRWLLDRIHPGRVHFTIEEAGAPSRWNTLRALRVLEWWDAAG